MRRVLLSDSEHLWLLSVLDRVDPILYNVVSAADVIDFEPEDGSECGLMRCQAD